MKTADTFPSESAMQTSLRRAAVSIFCTAGEPWVMLDEHQIHSRIPDLVLARIDTEALAERIEGGWGRALSPTELRALRALRPDRGRSLTSAAEEMRVGPDRARETLHRLVVDAFVERTPSGGHRRLAPVRPVVDRVIAIEAKRSDLGRAFSQARAHSACADVSVVAFDLVYRSRAEKFRDLYAERKLACSASRPPTSLGSTSYRGAAVAWSRPWAGRSRPSAPSHASWAVQSGNCRRPGCQVVRLRAIIQRNPCFSDLCPEVYSARYSVADDRRGISCLPDLLGQRRAAVEEVLRCLIGVEAKTWCGRAFVTVGAVAHRHTGGVQGS